MIEAGQRPWGIAISRTASRATPPTVRPNDVSVIDTASKTVVAKIPVGTGPVGHRRRRERPRSGLWRLRG